MADRDALGRDCVAAVFLEEAVFIVELLSVRRVGDVVSC